MPANDITTAIGYDVAFTTQAIVSDTTTTGAIIDSQGFESVDFSIVTGTITDGTYTLIIEDGEDPGLSDAAVIATDLLVFSSGQTALPTFDLNDDDIVKHFGIVNHKRYSRLKIVSAGTTSGGTFTVVAMKGHAAKKPTS